MKINIGKYCRNIISIVDLCIAQNCIRRSDAVLRCVATSVHA